MNSCCKNSRHIHHRHRGHHHCPNFDRPLVLIRSIPYDGQTGVSPYIKAIKLIFGRDFDNDRGLVNVYNEIDMWQGTDEVPIRIRRGRNNCGGHQVILVIPYGPLLGGVTYKVRVKSFIVDRFGESREKCKLIVFTTGCR